VGVADFIPNTLIATAPRSTTRLLAAAVHRGLLAEDEQGKLIPMLAESVPTLENGGARFAHAGVPGLSKEQLVVTFRLRDNLRWSDGQPLTSADLQFTYAFLQQKDIISNGLVESIDRIETPDSRTVVVVYKPGLQPLQYNRPFGDMLYPAHVFKGLTPSEVDTGLCALRPVGAGPYVIREWRYVGEPYNQPMPGVVRMSPEEAGPVIQIITLEPNPYFFNGQPAIQRIIFEVIPNKQILLERLHRNELDMVIEGAFTTVSPEVQALMHAGVILDQSFGQGWARLDFNLLKGPLVEPLVRQAIAQAIDRQAIVQAVFGDKGRVMQSWIPASSWAYQQVLTKYEYDPVRARVLLAEAGYVLNAEGFAVRDGKRLQVEFYFDQNNETDQQVATHIQKSLKAVGIEVSMRAIPRGALLGGNGVLEKHEFDMILYGWQGSADPEGFSLWHSSKIPNPENDWWGDNYAGWRNMENDTLLERLRTPASREEQIDWLSQQQQIFATDLPVLPLFEYPKFALHTSIVQGLKMPMGITPSTWNIEDWELSASRMVRP
jgi:peptide/nickel transport system substrate-binding protein